MIYYFLYFIHNSLLKTPGSYFFRTTSLYWRVMDENFPARKFISLYNSVTRALHFIKLNTDPVCKEPHTEASHRPACQCRLPVVHQVTGGVYSEIKADPFLFLFIWPHHKFNTLFIKIQQSMLAKVNMPRRPFDEVNCII